MQTQLRISLHIYVKSKAEDAWEFTVSDVQCVSMLPPIISQKRSKQLSIQMHASTTWLDTLF